MKSLDVSSFSIEAYSVEFLFFSVALWNRRRNEELSFTDAVPLLFVAAREREKHDGAAHVHARGHDEDDLPACAGVLRLRNETCYALVRKCKCAVCFVILTQF